MNIDCDGEGAQGAQAIVRDIKTQLRERERQALREHPLAIALCVSVPLLIADLRAMDDESFEYYRERWLDPEIAQQVCEHGDDLLYRGKHSAATFVTVSRALAALAFVPGGVLFVGERWEATRP